MLIFVYLLFLFRSNVLFTFFRRFASYPLKDTVNLTQTYPSQLSPTDQCSGQQCDDIVLDCGKPVNFTYYDNLVGVVNRNKHPLVPEPNVVMMFKKNDGNKVTDIDIDLLEKRLKKAKREVQLLQK